MNTSEEGNSSFLSTKDCCQDQSQISSTTTVIPRPQVGKDMAKRSCPLDSMQHLESGRDRKQSKEEYLQILAKLDCLGFPPNYDTIELSVLGHYH